MATDHALTTSQTAATAATATVSAAGRMPSGAGSRPDDTWMTERPRTALIAGGGVFVAALAGVLAVESPKFGIGLIGAVALVVVVLVRPFIGGVILVAVVPATSGLAPGFLVPNVRVSELLIGVVGITLLVSVRRRDAAPWGVLDWALLAYGVGWLAFGAFNAFALHENIGISGWGTNAGQLQFFLLYRGARVAFRTTSERHKALAAVLVASVVVAGVALLQQVKAPGVNAFLLRATDSSSQMELGSTVHRATGPFVNWAALAGYLLPVLLVMIALALSGRLRHRRRAAIGVFAIVMLGLLITAELSAITCLIAGVIVLGAQYGHMRKMVRWILIAVVVLGVVGGSFIAQRLGGEFAQSATHKSPVPQTISYRMGVWTNQYIPAIEERPLAGYGEALPASISWPYPESQYFAEAIEGGLPMLLLLGALTWAMIERARKIARSRDPFDVALGRALLVMVVALIAMDGIWPYLSNGGLAQMLWALFAIASPAAASRHEKAQHSVLTQDPRSLIGAAG